MAAGRHGSIDVVGAPGRLLNLPGLLRLLCRLSLLGNLLDDGTAVVGVRLPDAVYSLARLAETWRDEEIERIVRDAVAKVLGTPSKQVEPDRDEGAVRVETTPSKPVEPDRDEGAVRVETTRQPKNRPNPGHHGFDTASSQSEQAGSTSFGKE